MRFEYWINLDERGEFRADVRAGGPNGRSVYEIDGTDIFEDGFMRHKHDLEGLRAYLVSLGVLPPGAALEAGS